MAISDAFNKEQKDDLSLITDILTLDGHILAAVNIAIIALGEGNMGEFGFAADFMPIAADLRDAKLEEIEKAIGIDIAGREKELVDTYTEMLKEEEKETVELSKKIVETTGAELERNIEKQKEQYRNAMKKMFPWYEEK